VDKGLATDVSFLIRPYGPADRPAVRRICEDTADRGAPLAWLRQDREFVVDLVTRYYTDYEPESTWVAESDGRVIGYLTAALDNRLYHQA
jgi:hypothetical protein